MVELSAADCAGNGSNLLQQVTNLLAQLLVLALLMAQFGLSRLMLGYLELQLSLGKLTNFVPAADGTMLAGALLSLSLDSCKSLLTRRELLVGKISALLTPNYPAPT